MSGAWEGLSPPYSTICPHCGTDPAPEAPCCPARYCEIEGHGQDINRRGESPFPDGLCGVCSQPLELESAGGSPLEET